MKKVNFRRATESETQKAPVTPTKPTIETTAEGRCCKKSSSKIASSTGWWKRVESTVPKVKILPRV